MLTSVCAAALVFGWGSSASADEAEGGDIYDEPPRGSSGPAYEPLGPGEPVVGFLDGTAFVRSPDNLFVLMPSLLLQVDGVALPHPTEQMPSSALRVRRARLGVDGWVGSRLFFSVSGDFAASNAGWGERKPRTFLGDSDAYVGVAPFGDRVILQAGQFDAPFTLENRTADKHLDFMERSLTVRALGQPANKEVGVMVHGLPLGHRLVYASLGVFNGDGGDIANADRNLDFMGRLTVAPFVPVGGFFPEGKAVPPIVRAFENVTVGGSLWLGKRDEGSGLAYPQSTPGGFGFFMPTWTGPAGRTLELRQNGLVRGYAAELNVPIAHRLGARFELVRKTQGLTEIDAAAASASNLVGRTKLEGWSYYLEAWAWVLGDDRIVGEPGLELPYRLSKRADPPPDHGLMIALRLDDLDETLTCTCTPGGDSNPNRNPNVGKTHVVSPVLGINYLYTRRFRATVNYALSLVHGTTATVAGGWQANGGRAIEREMLFRLGMEL